jgi:hypothetical protein
MALNSAARLLAPAIASVVGAGPSDIIAQHILDNWETFTRAGHRYIETGDFMPDLAAELPKTVEATTRHIAYLLNRLDHTARTQVRQRLGLPPTPIDDDEPNL